MILGKELFEGFSEIDVFFFGSSLIVHEWGVSIPLKINKSTPVHSYRVGRILSREQ